MTPCVAKLLTRMPQKAAAIFLFSIIVLAWTTSANAEEIVWWAPNWGQARAVELAHAFEVANPGITVKIEQTVADGLQNRVQVVLRAGSPPDLIDINSSWNVPFAATGALAALDDDVAAAKLDLSDMVPAALAASKLNGKLYGLPYRAESHALLYNKGLFREAGLDPDKPPQTWSELLEAAKKLTRTNAAGQQQYGLGVVGGGEVANLITRMVPFIWSNGGDVLSDDGTQVLINRPEAVQAVTFYTELYTKYGVAPPSTLQNDGLALRRLFTNGVIAMYPSGQFDLAPIHQEAPKLELGVGLLPRADGGKIAGVLGGWSFILPKASAHHAAAWKLAAFLMQPERMGFYTDTFPARQSAMGLPRFQNPELKPYKEMLGYARPVPTVAAWVRIVQTIYDTTQQVLLKGATPQDGMNTAAKQIEALLKR